MQVKTRGRPRQFDEAEAVAAAIRVFWEKGYDGATIDDLVEHMGVVRPSLYAVFGDKQQLFLRCLKEYGAELGQGALAALNGPTKMADALKSFLAFSVQRATEGPLGCLIVCVAPLVDDPEVRTFLAQANAQTTEAVARRLRTAIATGELAKEFPVTLRARLAIDLSRGLAVRARMHTPRKELLRDASEATALLLR